MEEVKIRLAEKKDRGHWVKWLSDEDILQWFPMCNDVEVEDAVRIWESYISQKCIWTAEIDKKPVGVANLYLQMFKKVAHQCLFAIIIDPDYRNKGIGSKLLDELEKKAKEEFHIEQLHLEVYEGNIAQRLYERRGFTQYGYQKNFLKEPNRYIAKIFMYKFL